MIKRFVPFIFIVLALLNGCQKELSTSPEDILLSKNALVVESYPTGAKIFIDGKNSGQYTPDTLFWLREGNIKITLKLNLFKDTSITIYMNPSDTQKVFFNYLNNTTMFGIMSFDSAPRDAEIFLNDSSLNQKTPYETRKVLPGIYTVTYKKPGHWDQSKIVTVRTSFTTYVNQNLTDTLTWINYDTSRTDIPSNYLTALAIGKDYVKWAGSIDAGLIKFDDKVWTQHNTLNSILPDNKINYIHIDNDNVKWVCTDNGLIKIDGEIWTLYNTSNSGIPDNRVTAVSSNEHRLWVGTMGGGVTMFDGNSWEYMNTSNSMLPSNQINFILNQSVHTWICTRGGLLKVSEFLADTSYILLTEANDGMPNDNVKTVAIDVFDRPWIGFGTEGLTPGGSAVKQDRFWETFINKPSDYVYSIAIDKANTKWFGSSENGLAKFNSNVWTYFTMNNSLIGSDRIFKVIIDELGYKWMASYGGGLVKYKGN